MNLNNEEISSLQGISLDCEGSHITIETTDDEVRQFPVEVDFRFPVL